MLNKIRSHSLTIIALILVIAGGILFIYPNITNSLNNKITDQEISNFDKAVQSMKQPDNDKPVLSDAKTKTVQAVETPLDKLLQKVQLYNQSIYDNGQNGLVDAFSYEKSSVDLSDYGIEDNMFGYIEIPKIDVKLGIYLGATSENMSKGAVHLTQTSLPIGGINTNSVIAAHRGTRKNGDMFRKINKMEVGDKVYITNAWEVLTYKVDAIAIIKPSEINKILIQEGRDMVTLISCNPYGQHYQRYVVYCERITDGDKEDK